MRVGILYPRAGVHHVLFHVDEGDVCVPMLVRPEKTCPSRSIALADTWEPCQLILKIYLDERGTGSGSPFLFGGGPAVGV